MKTKSTVFRRLWEYFSIYLKLPALFTVTLLVSTLYFSWYGYRTSMELQMDSVDQRLGLCAVAVKTALADDFHMRAVAPDAISPEEQERNHSRLALIAEKAKLSYLYVLTRVGGKFYATASNKEPYFSPYADHWDSLLETEKDGVARYDVGQDSYGRSRSIISRQTAPDGRHYFIGADIPLREVDALRDAEYWHYLQVGFVSFFIVGLASIWVVWMITSPLKRLSDFIENLSREHFSGGGNIDSDLLPVSDRAADEVRLLAKNFHAMQTELSDYLVRLAETSAARERAESEMRIAGQIQQDLLSGSPPDDGLVSVWGAMTPAREAAGDFYDCIRLDERRLAFIIGDVSGKGVPAAMFMATGLTLFRAYAGDWDGSVPPGDFLSDVTCRIDRDLALHNEALLFVTCIAGILDCPTGAVTMVNCGHTMPLWCGADGETRYQRLEPGCVMGAGMIDSPPAFEAVLRDGEAILLYTDGVTEAQSRRGDFFGEERLRRAMRGFSTMTSRMAVEKVFAAVHDFSAGCDLADDLAVVCIRLRRLEEGEGI